MAQILFASSYKPESDWLREAKPILEERGHTVSMYHDGALVTERIQSGSIQVLVLSFSLVERNGYEILETIEAMDSNNRPKVVWMSYINEHGEPHMNWDWKVVSTFLIAPFTKWHIVVAVEQLLYRRHS